MPLPQTALMKKHSRPKTEIKIISIELTTYKASEEDSVSSAKTESDASSPKNDSETTSSNVK